MPCRRMLRILPCGSISLLLSLVIGCGNDDPARPRPDQLSLLFLRDDSSTIQFPASARAWIWCGAWEEDAVPTPTLHVLFRSPVEVNTPGWELKAVCGGLTPGDTLRFPNTFVWDQPEGAHIFLYDPPTELATDQEYAGGWIVFHQVPCPGGEEVAFEIDGVLGSEFADMPTAAIRGRFSHPVTGPPPWIGW